MLPFRLRRHDCLDSGPGPSRASAFSRPHHRPCAARSGTFVNNGGRFPFSSVRRWSGSQTAGMDRQRLFGGADARSIRIRPDSGDPPIRITGLSDRGDDATGGACRASFCLNCVEASAWDPDCNAWPEGVVSDVGGGGSARLLRRAPVRLGPRSKYASGFGLDRRKRRRLERTSEGMEFDRDDRPERPSLDQGATVLGAGQRSQLLQGAGDAQALSNCAWRRGDPRPNVHRGQISPRPVPGPVPHRRNRS